MVVAGQVPILVGPVYVALVYIALAARGRFGPDPGHRNGKLTMRRPTGPRWPQAA